VTNSERRISRQRPFLPLPGEAKPDWWIVAQVAQRLGYGEAFNYESAADIFREHAALSAYENEGVRDFDIGAYADIDGTAFDAMAPFQWPRAAGCAPAETRFFANGDFFTPDRKARFVAPEAPALHRQNDADFSFTLNTGRVRDQWHTMTRTGLSPRLASHLPEPFVEVHPDDARDHYLADQGFARVATRYGSCVLKVHVTDSQRQGSLFAPIHWNGSNASSARIGELVNPATDPYSGQPESKATPASIERVDYRFAGFVLSRRDIALPKGTWWVKAAANGGEGYLFASNESVPIWQDWAGAATGGETISSDLLDEPRGIYRAAIFRDGQLDFCLFLGPASQRPQWDAAKAVLAAGTLEERQRRALLSGQSADGMADHGPIVCACFGVGLKLIRNAIATGEATDVAGIGKALRAGTNCGSCQPELKRIIAHEQRKRPAHAV
jgi:assimilatory nitrate reductase catalytic subunit